MDATTKGADADGDLRVRLLGPVGLERAGASLDLGGPKQRAVVAVLALRAGDTVDRDSILTAVWGEDVDPGRARSLHTYVSNLRTALDGRVVHQRDGYRLEVPPEAVDARRFEQLVTAARNSYVSDPGGAADRLREGLSWWRGRPFADLDGTPALDQHARRLEHLRLDAVELRVEADLLSGRHEAVVGELEALAAEHPLRERFRAQHMIALYRCGRQVEALRSYREAVHHLAEELGVEPMPELQALEHAILGHDRELLAGPFRTTTQRLAVLAVDAAGTIDDRSSSAVVEAALTAGRGRMVRTQNGRSAAVFADIEGAIVAAEQLVRAGTPRVGIDRGEVELIGADVRGAAATRAGRLCSLAHPGQILLSATASHDVAESNGTGRQLRMLGTHEIHGFASPERICQLVLAGLPSDFPELRHRLADELDAPIPPGVPGYELRSPLRNSPLGAVWRAYQPAVGREVSLTLVHPEVTATPALAHRFDIAARSAARLAHPHIAPLLDFWRDAHGAVVVSSLIDGETLAAHPQLGADAVRVLRQLAAALDHVHAQGVVLGAIEPSTILVDTEGNAFLTEIGLALDVDELAVRAEPELCAPETGATGPTPATDRYAFAALARCMLRTDDHTESVFARATARDPADRYPTAAAFIIDLAPLAASPPDGADGDDPTPTPKRNPYKGLRAFDEADHADFYGRAAVVAELLAAVATHPMVTVVGASGSGKSSIVRAGLLPALASGAIPGSEAWEHAVVTPGSDPVAAIDRALRDCTGDLVLVVDQMEELYTHVDDDSVRDRFVDLVEDALSDADRSIRVVATLRADFFDRPLSDHRLSRLVTSAVITVIPPDHDELFEMVSAPASAVGLRWEPGLATRIVHDAAAPGGLPLAQYALTELVERRRGDLLTTIDYERVGRVAGAVATRAESVFVALTDSERAIARSAMLRLITVDDTGSSEARRRVRRSELLTPEFPAVALDRLLDAFVSERLLVADHDPVTRTPTVEIAHEALVDGWPRFRSWIEDERADLITGRRFRAAMQEWDSAGRGDDYLLGGDRLATFTSWSESRPLPASEREFLDACTSAERLRRRTHRRRRNTVVGVLAVVAVVTSSLGLLAISQARRADDNAATALAERDRAEAQTAVARARELTAAAVAAIGLDPGLAKALALGAVDTAEPTLETVSVLRQAVAADRTVARHPWPDSIDRMAAVAISPDGSLVAYAGASAVIPDTDRLEVRDVATWNLVWSTETYGYGADGIWFSPDSSHVVVGLSTWVDDDVPVGVRVFDARTGEVLATHDTGRCGATVSDVSASAAVLQVWPPAEDSCTWEGVEPPLASLEVLDLVSGESIVVAPAILDVRPKLSDDGRLVAFVVDTERPTVIVEEVATGRRVAELDPERLGVSGLLRELSPDGSLVAMGDDPIAVVDVEAGRVVAGFGEHASPPHSLVWDRDGASIWSVAPDGNVFEWDPLDGSVLTTLLGQGGSGDVRASAGGEVLLLDDLNGRSMTIAAPRDASELWFVPGCVGGGSAPLRTVTSAVGTVTAQFECRDGLRTMLLDESGAATGIGSGQLAPGVALSPTGSSVARFAPTADGTAVVVDDLESGETVELSDSSDASTRGIEWSPDGRSVIAFGSDHVRVWDAVTGAPLADVTTCGLVSDVIVAPDADEMVIGCFDEPWVVVSTTTWSTTARPEPPAAHFATFPGYSADGSVLVALNGGTGSTSLLWLDAETFEVVERLDDVHPGAPTAWAMSPSGTLAATASGDGLVKVWDVAARRQTDQIDLDVGVAGVAFASDTTLVAATDRGVGASTLDVDELVRIARTSPTRELTRAECERYAIDGC